MEDAYNLKKMSKEERKKLMKKFWWGKVDDKKLAKFITSEAAKAFYVLAVIQAVIGVLLYGPFALVDAALFALFAFLMAKYMSRVSAVILLILAILSALSTLINLANGGGGTNLVLAVLFLWMALRGTAATFAYHKLGGGSKPAGGSEPVMK